MLVLVLVLELPLRWLAAVGQEQPVNANESGCSTDKVSGPQNAGPLERRVRHCATENRAACARCISARAQKHLKPSEPAEAKAATATAPQRTSA